MFRQNLVSTATTIVPVVWTSVSVMVVLYDSNICLVNIVVLLWNPQIIPGYLYLAWSVCGSTIFLSLVNTDTTRKIA